MQGVQTNFDIDIFSPIIKYIEEITQVKYNGQMANAVLMPPYCRPCEGLCVLYFRWSTAQQRGRGYVERRLLRRAIRDGTQLGIKDCFLYKLVPIVSEVMQEQYPDIKQRREKYYKDCEKRRREVSRNPGTGNPHFRRTHGNITKKQTKGTPWPGSLLNYTILSVSR